MNYKIRSKHIEEELVDIPSGSIILETIYLIKRITGEYEHIGSIDRRNKYYYIQHIYYKIDKSDEEVDIIQHYIEDGMPEPNISNRIIRRITYMCPIKESE